MYIGDATDGRTLCSRLVECIVGNVSAESPAPTAVRLIVWAGNVFTVAYDGEPLPIHPVERGGVSHPELYTMFMTLLAPSGPLYMGAAVANALSARLVVSTVHEGGRYRAAFSRGGLVSLLFAAPTEETLGTNWLTFKPDPEVTPGEVTPSEADAIIRRLRESTPATAMTAVNRVHERPDWW